MLIISQCWFKMLKGLWMSSAVEPSYVFNRCRSFSCLMHCTMQHIIIDDCWSWSEFYHHTANGATNQFEMSYRVGRTLKHDHYPSKATENVRIWVWKYIDIICVSMLSCHFFFLPSDSSDKLQSRTFSPHCLQYSTSCTVWCVESCKSMSLCYFRSFWTTGLKQIRLSQYIHAQNVHDLY